MSENLKPIGHKFWHETFETNYVDACVSCGRMRVKGETDYSYNSEQFCANCGKSYIGESKRVQKHIYVIGHFTQWDGKQGYMLSETKPTDIEANRTSGKGYSYWSYLVDEVGSKYYEKPQLTNHK